ncbi:hypothetical protein ACROYT_G015580 [Oculina patagonica]
MGGDHLTVERAISAVNAVGDADTPFERLQGLVLKQEDFHCEMNFLQKQQLYNAVGKLVEKYVFLEIQPTAVLFTKVQEAEQPQRYNCRYPECDKNYQHEKRRNNPEVSVHGLTIRNHEERSPPDYRNEDGVFNYSHNIVKTGLLFQDFQDAIKEGDGARMEYLWKFMMLLFKVAGKTKYSFGSNQTSCTTQCLADAPRGKLYSLEPYC